MLFDRIPIEPAFGLHGDMVDQTSRAGTVTDFCRRNGRFSALDTLQPIAVLIVALIEMNLVGADDAVEYFRIAGNQGFRSRLTTRISRRNHLVGGDKDPSLSAVKLDAVGKIAADIHSDTVGVDGMGQE